MTECIMKVILLQDVDKLGAEGDVVTVRDGYGRNFLIPTGVARVASKGMIRAHEETVRQQARKRTQQKESAQQAAKQLEGIEVIIPARTGEENRIFGSVTAQQVVDELNKKGFEIDRRKVDLSEEIRRIGVYTATVKLHSEVTAQVKIQVVSEEEQAQAGA
jgi:large subunit ribosomal protein L9